jgi:hypothetical protein
LRRLKGSKIPTMTAAGLSMEIPITTSTPDNSDDLRTVNESELRTRPPPRGGPLLDMDAKATLAGPTLAGTPAAKASQAIPVWQQGSVSLRAPSDPELSAVPLPPPPEAPALRPSDIAMPLPAPPAGDRPVTPQPPTGSTPLVSPGMTVPVPRPAFLPPQATGTSAASEESSGARRWLVILLVAGIAIAGGAAAYVHFVGF